jgi:hypothetical protein
MISVSLEFCYTIIWNRHTFTLWPLCFSRWLYQMKRTNCNGSHQLALLHGKGEKSRILVYGGVCMRTCVPLQLLNQLTDFHKTLYEQCAVLGNSRTTFFDILHSAITIWCEAGTPPAFEVLRCCMVINFRKIYSKVCLCYMSEEKIDEVWSMYKEKFLQFVGRPYEKRPHGRGWTDKIKMVLIIV